MFGRGRLDTELALLQAGEAHKDNPVISAVARALVLQFTGVTIDDETVLQMSTQLEECSVSLDVSPQVIQYALLAAEPRLGEYQETATHTY